MRRSLTAGLLGIGLSAFAAEAPLSDIVPAPMTIFNFDLDRPGQRPAHFTAAATGSGQGFQWDVRKDPHAKSSPNVLAQNGNAEPGENFALLILDDAAQEHGEVAVWFKILSVEENQAVGIVWRYRDPQTYYVVTADSHEDLCSVYYVKKGKRKLIDEEQAIVTPYAWHEFRIVFTHKNYSGFIDGELVLGGKDASSLEPGHIGLWTPSGVAVQFDDFRVSR